MLRPDLLTYWTGKTICTDPNLMTVALRQLFVDRLFDILMKGFWMNRPDEKLTGGHMRSPYPGSVSYKYKAAMTCFTETRLAQSDAHCRAYGLLGVGVDRGYVLQRFGAPVHYVRNDQHDTIVGTFFDLRARLIEALRSPHITDPADLAALKTALVEAEYIGVFLKAMSNTNASDYTFLEENEWRVVAHPKLLQLGYAVRMNPLLAPPFFRLTVRPQDVRVLIAPDSPTRDLVVHDPRWAAPAVPIHVPILTVEECRSL